MPYFLSQHAVLKWLEEPSVYDIKTDELYELDEASFAFLRSCTEASGCVSDDAEFVDYCLGEGILIDRPVAAIRPALVKSPQPSLRYLELQITDNCNLRCRHCYIGESAHRELAVRQIEKVLSEFEEMQGLRLLITGGEPLLHSCFKEINEMLPSFGFRKVLFTNGHLIKSKLIEGLNVEEIQISIDGLEDAHDSLRGPGSYKTAIRSLELVIASGLHASVSTMVHRKNLADFSDMDGMFRKMGVRDWTVDIPCLTGRLSENPEFALTPEEAGRYLGYGFGGGIHGGEAGYGCGLHLMSVSADGSAAKCTFYSDRPAGNIEEGLALCWSRISPVRIGDLKCDCRHLDSCRGGCRYRAELMGDPLGKDLYRCSFFDIIN